MRYLNTLFDPEKSLYTNHSRVFGVGNGAILDICSIFGVCPEVKINTLSSKQLDYFKVWILKTRMVSTELKKVRLQQLQRLANVPCFRTLHHYLLLPVRNQRTHSNSRTAFSLLKKNINIFGKVRFGYLRYYFKIIKRIRKDRSKRR